MSLNTCWFIRPKPKTDAGFRQQMEDIRDFIKPAIEMAGLEMLGPDGTGGNEIADVSPELIRYAHEADIVVVDANRYDEESFASAPYLCYFLAFRHAMGNRTLLVCKAKTHLPATLQMHHTLVYGGQNTLQFVQRFKQTVENILGGRDSNPDNPIQQFLREKGLADQVKQAQAEAQAKAEEIARLKQEQNGSGKKIATSPITFRRVS